jgi:hypothetical protein
VAIPRAHPAPGHREQLLHRIAIRSERQRDVELRPEDPGKRTNQRRIGHPSVEHGVPGLFHARGLARLRIHRGLQRGADPVGLVLPAALRAPTRLAHRLQSGAGQPEPLEREGAVELHGRKAPIQLARLIEGLERALEVSAVHEREAEVVERCHVPRRTAEVAQGLRVLALHQRGRA